MTSMEKELRKANRRMVWHDFCENTKRKATECLHWAVENKEGIILVVTGLGVAARFGKGIVGNYKVKQEQWYKDHHVYDHSMGAYVELKHKLTQKDWKEVNLLKAHGMTTTEALTGLGLIK